jgi:short-subunit dehydrogenase
MYSYSLLESFLFLSVNVNKKKAEEQLGGKTILITGASSGVGEQLVYQLADIPCHLILVARRGEQLSAIKEDLAVKAASVRTFQADLRNEAEMEAFLVFVHQLPNGLDIVVSNAGLSIRRSIFDSLDRYDDFSRTMAINYFAPVQLLLSIIPLLRKNNGQIINISTVNALIAPVPCFAAYQASKSAFDIWLRSVSPELRDSGIAITTIYLPLVRTPMIQPNLSYRNMPAMSPIHAAKVICKTMYTKKKKYKPWWIIFGQFASIFVQNFKEFGSKGR